MISLQLFGPPEVRADQADLRAVLAQPKRFALLVYLSLAAPRGAHRRDALVALFWPDRPEDAARAALSRATHFLRRSLGAELLIGRTVEELAVDHALLTSDVAEFERLRAAGDFAAAMALYRGDLLPGFHADDAPEFMRWLDELRSHLRDGAAACSRQLAKSAASAGATADTVAWSERALQLAPYDEQALQQLLQVLVAAGNRTGALRTYDAFASRLTADLEAEPSVEVKVMVERIRMGEAPAPPAASTSGATPSTPRMIAAERSAISSTSSTTATAHQAQDIDPADVVRASAARGLAVTTPAAAVGAPPRGASRSRWAMVGAGALLLASASVLALRPRTPFDRYATLGDRVQLTRSNHVSFPAISPDGKQLAYLEQRCDDAACGQTLVVQDVGGLSTRALVDSIGMPRGVKWSPDRRTLYFYGRHGTQTGAWLQDVMGGAPRLIGNGPADFFADGDSVLIGPTFHADSLYTLRVASREGVVHDSIVLRVPGGGISALSAIPGTPYFVALVNRAPRGWWQVFDRTGRLVDHVENACICGGVASNDALWLSRPGGPAGEVVVRLAVDRASGRVSVRQDTVLKGVISTVSVTADGSRFVVGSGQAETSVWLPSMQELSSSALSDDRRIEHSSQLSEWRISPDGARLLITRTVPVGTRSTSAATVRLVSGGAEVPLRIAGQLGAAQWADSVTVAFRARDAGDTLYFGLADVRDGMVRERFVPGEKGVWAHARIRDGWAWIMPGGKRVRATQRGHRYEWPAPKWFEQVYGLGGSAEARTPILFGGNAGGDSVAVVALDIASGRFESWYRGSNEGLGGMQLLGEGRVVLTSSRAWPYFDYTLLTGPSQATPILSTKHPNLRVSFSSDLSRAVAVEYRLQSDAFMYEVLRR